MCCACEWCVYCTVIAVCILRAFIYYYVPFAEKCNISAFMCTYSAHYHRTYIQYLLFKPDTDESYTVHDTNLRTLHIGASGLHSVTTVAMQMGS